MAPVQRCAVCHGGKAWLKDPRQLVIQHAVKKQEQRYSAYFSFFTQSETPGRGTVLPTLRKDLHSSQKYLEV